MAPDLVGAVGFEPTGVAVALTTGLVHPCYRVSSLLQPLGYAPVKPVSWINRRLNRASDRVAFCLTPMSRNWSPYRGPYAELSFWDDDRATLREPSGFSVLRSRGSSWQPTPVLTRDLPVDRGAVLIQLVGCAMASNLH